MVLKQLLIHRENDWDGACKGALIGKIKFRNETAEIELRLTDAAAKKILEFVAEGMVDAAKEVATKLTAEVILQSAGALESRPAEIEANF